MLVGLLKALQPIPEAFAAPEQDRDHRHMHVVDQPGRKELPDHGRSASDAHVLAACSLRATSIASAGEASMKWNVVPPSISIDGRG